MVIGHERPPECGVNVAVRTGGVNQDKQENQDKRETASRMQPWSSPFACARLSAVTLRIPPSLPAPRREFQFLFQPCAVARHARQSHPAWLPRNDAYPGC